MEETLRLTLELPAQVMDQAAHLLEAARLLLETGRAREFPAPLQLPLEREESGGFDEARFRALAAEEGEGPALSADVPPPREAVSVPAEDAGPAPTVSAEAMAELPAAEAVRALSPSDPAETGRDGYDTETPADPDAVRVPEETQERDPAAPGEELPPPPGPPSVRPGDMSPLPDAPTAQPKDDASEIAPAIQVTTRRDTAPPSSSRAIAAAPPVAEQIPDSLRPAGTAELSAPIAPRPAPLTAEAVSLAFRRDDRRYDNGFPFY